MNTTSRFLAPAALAAGLALTSGAFAATTITTVPAWNGATVVSPWSVGGQTQVYGQSITAPALSSTLTGFSFRIRDTSDPIPYTAFVYAWNGSNITGPALFSLGGQSFGGGGTNAFLPVSFNTSVAVTPGSQYMLFLSTIDETGPFATTSWGFVGNDAYAGGQFQFLSTSTFNDLVSLNWRGFLRGQDLAFTATFDGTAVVPVPGALGLMLSGAAALGFLARRRRNA